jgi:hypothetical protein
MIPGIVQTTDKDGADTASGRHRGIVTTFFADGSLRADTSTVNRTVWWALATWAGGEVISTSDF